jgi:tape measure domain-containing protein
MSGAKQGLADLSAAGSKLNVDGAAQSIDGLSGKMIALSTIGITALATLTTKILEVGGQLAKSFTLAPVTAGFSEFELKMGSIQTIMAGSGASLGEVNEKLNQLNAYSDKTIYSFQDMTSNIGKFTNAGVSLDKSVDAIQGVANVAAVSGANAEEASRAMYNFGQALSAGHVKLIDWKSIELANMGTVEFKQQLIDSAVAMGTLTKAADGTFKTLKGTEVNTKNFGTTLNEAWLSSEALTETLGRYSDASTDIGKKAEKAATQVKTFSQMIDTMKEGLQSGWAQSFEHIFGNFDEGVELWSSIKDGFDSIAGASAAARNEMLAGWKKLGGRDLLIKGFTDAIKGIGTILKPVKEAFREIFPKTTAQGLYNLTKRFAEFAESIKIGADTAAKLKAGFKTFFAVLDIGWEIIKGVASVFFTLIKGVMKLLGPILGLAAGNSKFVHSLHEMLVQEGGIKKFFNAINFVILKPFEAVTKLTGAIIDFFRSLNFGKAGKKGAEEATESLKETTSIAEKLLKALKNVFGQIGDFLGDVGQTIGKAFEGLGGAIAKAIGAGDFNQVLNIIKTGLLGGILTMLVKFFRNGIKFDFGQGKLFDKIGRTFDTLTASLKTLQAQVRANILMKIAIAMGILTLAIVALSLIDSAALTKAMAAITVGFLQLTGVMFALEKMSAGGGSIKIMAMAAGMVAMAAAMALLVIPIKMLSTMDLGELAKGLGAVTVGMFAMAAAIRIMNTGNKGIFRAAAAMILISVALIVLARAIKSFAEMNLTEMAWGLAQAAIGIGLLIMALKHMPDDIAKKGLGLLILAFSLQSLARVVKLFAGIPFGTMAKGFISIAAGLLLIGVGMQAFPDDMVKKALALVVMSGALYLMGKAIESVGNLPLGELIKGVGGLSVMLGVLAMAILVMDGAKGGVASLILGAAGLLIIGHAVEQVGKLPFGVLVKGILSLAAVLAVLALASVVAPGILLLGIALGAVGAALMLFGAGIALAGFGFEQLAKYGTAGMGHIREALQEFIRELPGFVSAFVVGLIQAAVEIGDAMPKLVKSIEKILIGLLQAIQNVIPEIGKTLSGLVDEGLRIFIDAIPRFVEAGFAMLTGWLTGVRDNIGEIVHLVGDIVTEFLDAFTEEIPEFIDSLVDLLATAFQEVAFGLGELMPRLMIGVGRSFLEGFWTGITEELGALGQLIRRIVSDVIGWFTSGFGIFSPSTVMKEIGKNIIQGLIDGVKGLFGVLKTVFVEIPGKVLGWIGNVAKTLFNKGKDFIGGLLGGVKEKVLAVKDWYLGLGPKIREWVGNAASTLVSKGRDFIRGLWTGFTEKVGLVTGFITSLPGKILRALGKPAELLIGAGKDLIRGLWGGMGKMKDWVLDKAKGFAGDVVDGVKGFFGIGSPSKVFMGIGSNLGQSLGMGLTKMARYAEQAALNVGNNVQKGWQKANTELTATLGNMDKLNPTITPVLDLAKVREEAKNINKLVDTSAISPTLSFDRANVISSSGVNQNGSDLEKVPTGPTEVNYNQTINAPTPLSAVDIYKQTKSLLAVTKDELEVA